MKRERQQTSKTVPLQHWAPSYLAFAMLAVSVATAKAQDVRGMQVCTVEKQMERRTSCLQANVEFLQDALFKLRREMETKIAGADRALAAARAETAALQSELRKLSDELTKLRAKPTGKK